ncbi:kinetochore-associated Ndc80 complex subunit spc25 [Saguinus oedipus]|uniref:Kinetochore protein SPC25 n=1 Tax=Saguinus oedipus TaxID=9490 RepID=A0ABQ9VKN7_SAGOE|nr:kinetochore-associated Ndc80 complex subunit spc25 [Saguinus oedipus]
MMVEDELALFEKSLNEFWNKFKSTDTSFQMAGLRDTYKDSLKAFAGCPEWINSFYQDLAAFTEFLPTEHKLVSTVQILLEMPKHTKNTTNSISRQNKVIQEKKDNLLKLIAEVKDKKQELEVLTANIQDLKEEYSRKKETISTANKANAERLKKLQKSADLYKDRLGLEIRKIYDIDQRWSEKLQFIFTNIDPKNPESPFMFSLHLNEARDYEVSDSAPHLECLAEFQENVRKTNNFSAFLANVRKAFTATVHN